MLVGTNGTQDAAAANDEAVVNMEGLDSYMESVPDLGEGTAVEDGAKPADQKADESAEQVKMVLFNYKGKTYEVPFDAVTKVPVDGKEEEAAFADLQKEFNGKKFYDRKLTEVDKERQAVEAKAASMQEGIDAIKEAVKLTMNGDPYAGLMKIVMTAVAESENADPSILLKNYLKQAQQAVNGKWGKLKPEQVDAIIAKKAAEYKETLLKRKQEKLDAVEKAIAFKDEFAAKLEESGISAEQFNEMAEELKKELDVDLDSMSDEARTDYVIRSCLDVDIPFKRFVSLARTKYSEAQVDRILENDEWVTALISVAKNTTDDSTVLATIGALFKEAPDQKEKSPVSSDSSKKSANAGTSEKAPPKTDESQTKGVPQAIFSMDDLIEALEADS